MANVKRFYSKYGRRVKRFLQQRCGKTLRGFTANGGGALTVEKKGVAENGGCAPIVWKKAVPKRGGDDRNPLRGYHMRARVIELFADSRSDDL